MELSLELGQSQRQWQVKQKTGPLWTLCYFYLLSLILLSGCRLALLVWQQHRLTSVDDVLTILLNGLRIDLASVSYLFIIPFLITALIWLSNRGTTLLYHLQKLSFSLILCFLLYMEATTPTFILEYDLRPNRLFVEYLIYPKEVMSMLWTGYKLEIFLTSLVLVAAFYWSGKLFERQWQQHSSLGLGAKILLLLIVFVGLFLGARGTVGHRPINPALVSFSNDHLLNDLCLNSGYSMVYAWLQMGNEKSAEKYYGSMPETEVIQQVRQATMLGEHAFQNPELPTMAYRQASYTGKPKNLVILLQESLGARYVGGLGGLPLSPNLDKLMQQGWNFEQLYATGTRSVRGIEAVVTGFTPTPSQSVVKLDKSQQHFFTLADFLRKQGYTTQFVYGGESHFDNMRSFFLGNGFQHIVDSPEFEKIDFEGSWGASDEDLYDQAHLEFEALHQQDKPFFSLVFTSSNHTPYEFPDGKIELYDQQKQTRNNAAKYADYALGQFLKKARGADYWRDTVFMVVADHDSRVAGASLVPIQHFHIPGVIFGEDIQPRQDQRLVSHIDIAPTLLSLIGVSGETPMLGHDLTRNVPEHKQRVMMQYDKNFAYMTRDGVTILQPGNKAKAFSYEQKKLLPMPLAPNWEQRAKAHVLFGNMAYQQGWYR